MRAETAANVRNAVELMDQTDEAEELVKTLVQLIEEKRLQVKVLRKAEFTRKRTSSTTARFMTMRARGGTT